MTRRLLSLAAVVAAASASAAQPPDFPPPAGPTTGEMPPVLQSAVQRASSKTTTPAPATPANIMVIKTAGQPERRVQVLKSERMPDGKVMTTVKDLGNGDVYTMIDAAPGGTVDSKPAPTTPVEETKKRPIVSKLIGSNPTPAVTTAPTMTTEPTAKRPAVSKLLLGTTTPTTPTTTEPKPVRTISSRLFGTSQSPQEMALPRAEVRANDPLLASPAAAAGVGRTGVVYDNAAPAPITPKPGFLTRLVGGTKSQPAPVVTAPVMTAPPTMQPPAVTPTKSQPTATRPTPPPAPAAVVIPSAAAQPAMSAAPALPIPVAPVPVAPVPVAPTVETTTVTADAIHVALPVGEVSPEVSMKDEITPLVGYLQTHTRPSFRMDAATGLAEGRFGSREEVKAVLAHAAKADPSPAVRGHCITMLSNLGYAEAGHVEMLKTWSASDEPPVRRAATAALAKMGMK